MSQPKTKTTTTAPVNEPDFFDQLGNKAFLFALLLVMLVAFFVFKDFLLLKNAFLYKDIGSDTLNGVYPFYRHYASYLQTHGWPTWSFTEGMGQSIMSGFLRDPFQLPAIVSGPQSMPRIYIYVEVTKILVGGMVFFFYLKSLRISNYSATLGALLFSFSGFMIIGACWYLFTFEALSLALFLLGFEKIYQHNKWGIMALATFLTGISFPVNLFPFGLFILFYTLFRFLIDQKFDKKKFSILLGRLILGGGVGLLLSGPFLLENIFQVLNSPRGGGPDSYFSRLSSSPMFATANKVEFGSSVMRMLSNDILGTGNNYTGAQNYLESPLGYCGLISLLLFSQVFALVDKTKRRWYIALFAIWLMPTLFPYFRYAFWLFSGDYYRIYSFFLAIVLILFSVHSLDLIIRHKKVNLIALVATLLLWYILSSVTYKATITYPGGQQGIQELRTDDTVSFFVKTFLFFYAAAIYFLSKSNKQTLVKSLVLVLICFELIYLSSISINKRNIVSMRELTEKTGYNDYSIEAVNFIKSKEKGFYRIDKTYFSGGAMHGSITDHKIHDYYGTSSYNSFAQINYVNFMRGFDVIDKTSEFASRWVDGLRNRPLLEPLSQVKYMLTKSTTLNPLWPNTYDSIAKFGDVVVMRHKYALPFGYTYQNYMLESDFNKLSSTQKDLMSYQTVVLRDQDQSKAGRLKKTELKDSVDLRTFTWDYLAKNTEKLKKDTLRITKFEQDKIEGSIQLENEKLIYFSFPFDQGWHAQIDGKDADLLLVNYGMNGLLVPPGEHNIILSYELRYFGKGLILFFAGLILGIGLLFFSVRQKKSQTI